MKRIAFVIAAALVAVHSVQAQTMPHHASGAGPHADAALSEGEVRKVDKDAQKITLGHGPLANLDMPAMTMVFRVKDPAMLEQVKPGDKVRFLAEKIDGALTVTKLEPAGK